MIPEVNKEYDKTVSHKKKSCVVLSNEPGSDLYFPQGKLLLDTEFARSYAIWGISSLTQRKIRNIHKKH